MANCPGKLELNTGGPAEISAIREVDIELTAEI
jgi:hypothetical protein